MKNAFHSKNRPKNIQVEMLLKNYLETDLQSVLTPLNLMQHFCFYSRCTIKDNFITPKNIKSIIISIIGTALFSIIYMFKLVPLYFSTDVSLNAFFHGIYQFDAFFYISGLIVNLFVIVYQSPNFVAMILKISDVHHVLNDKKKLSRLKIMNWVMFGLAANIYGTDLISFMQQGMNAIYMMCVAILWSFDANLLYARGIVSLFQNKLDLWTGEIVKYTEIDFENGDVSRIERLKVINLYFNILDAFNTYKKVFQVMILYHAFETFIHDLIYVAMLIEVSKRYMADLEFVYSDPASLSSLTGWMLKNFALMTTISVQCDKFYRSVKLAQTACVVFMNSEKCSAEERKVCKNIIRAHSAEYSPLCACAVFHVDARLPLRLLGLVATYTVVLLQFAFIH